MEIISDFGKKTAEKGKLTSKYSPTKITFYISEVITFIFIP